MGRQTQRESLQSESTQQTSVQPLSVVEQRSLRQSVEKVHGFPTVSSPGPCLPALHAVKRSPLAARVLFATNVTTNEPNASLSVT
jgi:hypothetical protein